MHIIIPSFLFRTIYTLVPILVLIWTHCLIIGHILQHNNVTSFFYDTWHLYTNPTPYYQFLFPISSQLSHFIILPWHSSPKILRVIFYPYLKWFLFCFRYKQIITVFHSIVLNYEWVIVSMWNVYVWEHTPIMMVIAHFLYSILTQ